MNELTIKINKKVKNTIIYINNSNKYSHASVRYRNLIVVLDILLEYNTLSSDMCNYFYAQLDNAMVINNYRLSVDSIAFNYHNSKRYSFYKKCDLR